MTGVESYQLGDASVCEQAKGEHAKGVSGPDSPEEGRPSARDGTGKPVFAAGECAPDARAEEQPDGTDENVRKKGEEGEEAGLDPR